MLLESSDQQYWQAAVGYVELGMFVEADSELDKIDPFLGYAFGVLVLCAVIVYTRHLDRSGRIR